MQRDVSLAALGMSELEQFGLVQGRDPGSVVASSVQPSALWPCVPSDARHACAVRWVGCPNASVWAMRWLGSALRRAS